VNHHEGKCHCGAVGFAYRSERPPEAWSIRACQCSFCRAHSALSTSDAGGTLTFLEGAALRRYRFGQRTADFLLCSNCGVYIGAAITTSRGRFGIINSRALTPMPAGIPAPSPVNYEGEAVEERVARREARWTPMP
jgi:hypothetical protein